VLAAADEGTKPGGIKECDLAQVDDDVAVSLGHQVAEHLLKRPGGARVHVAWGLHDLDDPGPAGWAVACLRPGCGHCCRA
jgi:hypothetical protein